MPVYSTTDPDAIRTALASKLVSILPTLTWQRERWTWQKGAEIQGGAKLRNFDVLIGQQREASLGVGSRRAFGGGLQLEADVIVRVSYPVKADDLPRFLGADAQDLTSILLRLHEFTSAVFPFESTQDRAVRSTSTGEDGRYIGEHAFVISWFSLMGVTAA